MTIFPLVQPPDNVDTTPNQVEISIRALEGAMALEQEQDGELVVA